MSLEAVKSQSFNLLVEPSRFSKDEFQQTIRTLNFADLGKLDKFIQECSCTVLREIGRRHKSCSRKAMAKELFLPCVKLVAGYGLSTGSLLGAQYQSGSILLSGTLYVVSGIGYYKSWYLVDYVWQIFMKPVQNATKLGFDRILSPLVQLEMSGIIALEVVRRQEVERVENESAAISIRDQSALSQRSLTQNRDAENMALKSVNAEQSRTIQTQAEKLQEQGRTIQTQAGEINELRQIVGGLMERLIHLEAQQLPVA